MDKKTLPLDKYIKFRKDHTCPQTYFLSVFILCFFFAVACTQERDESLVLEQQEQREAQKNNSTDRQYVLTYEYIEKIGAGDPQRLNIDRNKNSILNVKATISVSGHLVKEVQEIRFEEFPAGSMLENMKELDANVEEGRRLTPELFANIEPGSALRGLLEDSRSQYRKTTEITDLKKRLFLVASTTEMHATGEISKRQRLSKFHPNSIRCPSLADAVVPECGFAKSLSEGKLKKLEEIKPASLDFCHLLKESSAALDFERCKHLATNMDTSGISAPGSGIWLNGKCEYYAYQSGATAPACVGLVNSNFPVVVALELFDPEYTQIGTHSAFANTHGEIDPVLSHKFESKDTILRWQLVDIDLKPNLTEDMFNFSSNYVCGQAPDADGEYVDC